MYFSKSVDRLLRCLADQPPSGQDTDKYSALRQLLTHVPDIVINCDHKKAMPRDNRVVGVCMFADISGKERQVYI